MGEHEGNMSRIGPNQKERSVDAERSASLNATMRHSCTFTHVDVFPVSLWTPDQNAGYLANIVQKPWQTHRVNCQCKPSELLVAEFIRIERQGTH